ncbi:hypothetical protein [Rubellimicrobium roseum]|uniref:hypothetical protein n=1 Tax=Rubellimicrobium roseum TaxID=687525 RepID=UPI001FE6DCB6|nr:hypothetical protein [Rubellimicrobium roseum]
MTKHQIITAAKDAPAPEAAEARPKAVRAGSRTRPGDYRTIAVHLRACGNRSEHIEVAMRLAHTFQASLTGALTLRGVSVPQAFCRPEALPADRLERAGRLAAEAESRFREAALARRLPVGFFDAEGDAAEILSYVGRLHDLLVVEQTDLGRDEIGHVVPEHCVAGTGRPVLVVPFRGTLSLGGAACARGLERFTRDHPGRAACLALHPPRRAGYAARGHR